MSKPKFSNRGTFRPEIKRVGPEDPTHWRYGGNCRSYAICLACWPSGVSTCSRCQTQRTVLVQDWSEFPAKFYDQLTGEQMPSPPFQYLAQPHKSAPVHCKLQQTAATLPERTTTTDATPAQGKLFS